MENRFEKQEEEKQDWGAYVKPPQTSRPSQESEASAQSSGEQLQRFEPRSETSSALCDIVREHLHALVENDGAIRPEQAAAMFAHLTICRDCAREFDELNRIVSVLNSMPLSPLPHDYSGLIMLRIEREMGGLYPLMDIPPNLATSSWTGEAAQQTSQSATQLNNRSLAGILSQTALPLWSRVVMLGAFFATLLLFLTSAWGRATLDATLSTVQDWLHQIAQATAEIPLLGAITAEAFNALSQSVHLLEETYLHIGANAMRGVFLDTAIAMGVYFIYQGRQKAKRAG